MKRRLGVGLFGVCLIMAAWAGDVLEAGKAMPLRFEEPRDLTGAIYSSSDAGRTLLFKFTRKATRNGQKLKVQRDFTCPDGTLAAQEQVLYEGDNLLSYQLYENQTGASGSATIRHSGDRQGSIEFQYRRDPAGTPKVRTEMLKENTLTADMVGAFLSSHWDALMHGRSVKCRYIVVSRMQTVGFTFSKESELRNGIVVKMEASSSIVATLVHPLTFLIEGAPPHRVLQYSGRTTPRIRTDEGWKDVDAVTVFNWGVAKS